MSLMMQCEPIKDFEVYDDNHCDNDLGVDYCQLNTYDNLVLNLKENQGISYYKPVYNYYITKYKESKNDMHSSVKKYFKDVSGEFEKIILDRKIMGGVPTVKGTRIPIVNILACLRDEMTINEICDAFKLTQEQIEEAVDYAITILKDVYLEDVE